MGRDLLSRSFVAAAGAIGEPFNPDFNGDQRRGVGYYQYIIRHGVRDSPAAAYFGGNKQSANLEIRLSAHVTKIHLAAEGSNGGQGPRATGVEYVDVSSIHTKLATANRSGLPEAVSVRARKEAPGSLPAVMRT